MLSRSAYDDPLLPALRNRRAVRAVCTLYAQCAGCALVVALGGCGNGPRTTGNADAGPGGGSDVCGYG
ncbi:MAG: hypothetical protein ACRELB_00200, partial [Polyangiaceae bacterium]